MIRVSMYMLFVIVLIGNVSYGQNIFDVYELELGKLLKEYKINSGKDNQVIQPVLLAENLNKVFNTIVFSNTDLVSNASAFGYSQNQEATSVSVNTNFTIKNKVYLKVGVNAEGGDAIFNLYASDSWSNNVGASVGLLIKLPWASAFYSVDKDRRSAEFTKDSIERLIFAKEPIYNQVRYSAERLDQIQLFLDKILENATKPYLQREFSELLTEFTTLKEFINAHEYAKAYVLLETEKKHVNEFRKVSLEGGFPKYIRDRLTTFDRENDITYGYSLQWIDVNLNLNNSTYNFTEENINASLLADFNTNFNLSDALNKLKASVSANFNYSRSGKTTVGYFQAGALYTSGSFLESILIEGTPAIKQNDTGVFVLEDEEGRQLGAFDNVDENFQTGALHMYGALFFLKQKSVGFNATLQHNYLINKSATTFYKNSITALLGPVVRVMKDGEAKFTFGIDIGWENAIYGTKISDDFTARIRVGIPFSIYKDQK